jgi:hypothetical protein
MKISKDKIAVSNRIQNDVDYIDFPKYDNSIKQLVEDYPDGVPDTIICKAMHITPETLEKLHKSAIRKLQKSFGV